MLDKSVRVKREELRKKSTGLREVAFDLEDKKKTDELRSKQDDTYKRWKFYDNLIKNIEKGKNYEVQNKKKRKR